MIPEAVRKQQVVSDEAHKQVYGSKGSPAGNPGSAEKPIDLNVNLSQSSNPSPAGESNSPGQAATPSAPNASAGDGPSNSTSSGEVIDWEQRFKTLQGKYNAEVPQLHAQNRKLQTELYAQQIQQVEPQQEASAAEDSFESLVTSNDIEDFGESTIDVIRRAAREEMQKPLAEMRAENEQLKKLIANTQTELSKDSYSRMIENLDNDVPNWKVTNEDPKFLEWLKGIDPFSGQSRHDLLRDGYEKHQTDRVKSFFHEYGKENAGSSAVGVPGQQSPVRLETLVAPGTPTDGHTDSARTQNSTPQGKQWTREEIKQFYIDAQRGSYQPQEIQRLESDIVRASKEGRIIP